MHSALNLINGKVLYWLPDAYSNLKWEGGGGGVIHGQVATLDALVLLCSQVLHCCVEFDFAKNIAQMVELTVSSSATSVILASKLYGILQV